MKFERHNTPHGAMNVYAEVLQGSEEWQAMRRGRATASMFKKILTAATCKVSAQAKGYIYQLIGDTIQTGLPPSFIGNAWTDRGLELEPEARKAFEELTGLETVPVGFVTRVERNSDVEIVGCSPDAMILDSATLLITAGLETKCPSPAVHIATIADGCMPDDHLQQVHGGMAVTGLDHWHFFSFCPGIKAFHQIIYRDEYTERLSAAIDDFVIQYVAMRKALMPKLQLQPTKTNGNSD